MKKIILIASLCAFAAAGIFANDSFTPAGSVSSYTKTTYNVTSKFGEYFRSVAVKDVHVFNSSGLETEVAYYYGKDEPGDKVTFTYDVSRNLTGATYTDAAGAVVTKVSREYQSDGMIKSESEFNAAGVLTGKTIYKYEPSKSTESYYDEKGALLSRNITTYTADGKVSQIDSYFADGTLSNKKNIYLRRKRQAFSN